MKIGLCSFWAEIRYLVIWYWWKPKNKTCPKDLRPILNRYLDCFSNYCMQSDRQIIGFLIILLTLFRFLIDIISFIYYLFIYFYLYNQFINHKFSCTLSVVFACGFHLQLFICSCSSDYFVGLLLKLRWIGKVYIYVVVQVCPHHILFA